MEMSIPDKTDEFIELWSKIIQNLKEGANILIHCWGGIGRAGTVGCCILSSICDFKDYRDVISYVWKIRSKWCVECWKQEDYVKLLFKL